MKRFQHLLRGASIPTYCIAVQALVWANAANGLYRIPKSAKKALNPSSPNRLHITTTISDKENHEGGVRFSHSLVLTPSSMRSDGSID